MAQFIGKTISLISNADIRYVGVLHEINSQESTVSLRNVRSYGTEGRRGGNEIPPSDNIYEFIVFRGSDVKDLTVSDTTSTPAPAPAPAAAAAAAPQPVDPAVSQVQQRSSLTQQQPSSLASVAAAAPSQQGYASYTAIRPTPGSFGGSLTSSSSITGAPVNSVPATAPVSSFSQKSNEKTSSSFSFASPNAVKSPVSGSQTPVSQPHAQESKPSYPSSSSLTSSGVSSPTQQYPPQSVRIPSTSSLAQTPQSTNNTVSQQPPVPTAPVASAVPSATTQEPIPTQPSGAVDPATSHSNATKSSQTASAESVQNSATSDSYQNAGPGSRPTQPRSQYNKQNYSGRSFNQGPPRGNNNGKKPLYDDFNFEEMNSKFSKTDVAKELDDDQSVESDADSSSQNKDSFYDRKSSFFDNISSTTKERIEGVEERPRRGDERRLNMETFGPEYVYKNSRGGYRGNNRRGGGGFRGGRGGNQNYGGGYRNYNSHNNNNNNGNVGYYGSNNENGNGGSYRRNNEPRQQD